MDIIISESKFENCLNYSLSRIVNRLAGLGCSSSCAGHDIESWVVTERERDKNGVENFHITASQ